jgi:ankyrin repeat protein
VLAGKEEVSQLLIKHSVDLNIEDINHRAPLHMVAYMGLSKATQMLLERGGPLKARLNARDKNSWTPLHLASERGHSGIAVLLLKFGAEVDAQDKDGMTPLHLASHDRDQHHILSYKENYQNTKTAQQLLEHGASAHVRNKNGQTPLHLASRHELFSTVALLLKFGADVDAQDNDAMTPLHLVLQSLSGDGSKIAQLLLVHGASVHVRDKNGQMPLHLASHHKLPSIVALLLQICADVDAQDNDAMTPLLLALQDPYNISGDDSQITKITQLLLEHGASVHVRNKDGQMPLHLASQHGVSRVVKLLLEFGADVDARDNGNITPLHFAVLSSPLGAFRCGSHVSESNISVVSTPDNSPSRTPTLWSIVETIKLLLRHGANLQMQNDEGETPLQVALSRGGQRIIDVLSSHDVRNDPDNRVGNLSCVTTPEGSESSSRFIRCLHY